MKKILITLLILGLIVGSVFSAGQSEEDTIKIGAIFAVTGGASFLGAPEAKTAEMVVEEINAISHISEQLANRIRMILELK